MVEHRMTAALQFAKDAVRGTLGLLGSLKLAVTLIVILAAVLAWATTQEAGHGREYAQWYVYHGRWFRGLLWALGVNILAATLVRFPWKRKLGFLVTHAGLLVLLAGALSDLPLRDRRDILLSKRGRRATASCSPTGARSSSAGSDCRGRARPRRRLSSFSPVPSIGPTAETWRWARSAGCGSAC